MPRTKGSKNRKAVTNVSVDVQIAQVQAELEQLQENVKAKKAELKALMRQKDEEEKASLLTAMSTSGKSVDEILAFLKTE